MPSPNTSFKTVSEAEILDAAMNLAEDKGWDNIRLYQVAERLDVSLQDILATTPDLNGVANVWFQQALAHMVQEPTIEFEHLHPWQRLFSTMELWLDHTAQHKDITAQILRSKLHPPHVHHWVPMIFDLSRLIHWWLDAASISATGRKRQLAEISLTGIFLSTLLYWQRDKSSEQNKTKALLKRRLQRAVRVLRLS